jgi:hypothetical protein
MRKRGRRNRVGAKGKAFNGPTTWTHLYFFIEKVLIITYAIRKAELCPSNSSKMDR